MNFFAQVYNTIVWNVYNQVNITCRWNTWEHVV